jgi:hypothetical protein
MAIDEASYGPDHPNVAIRLNNLAALLKDTDRLSEAEPLMRRSVAILIVSRRQGFQHPNLETSFMNYTSLLHRMGYSEAEIQARLRNLLPETNDYPTQ